MTVFVTGATAGFGAAIARRFAIAGTRVIAAGRRRERLDALAAEHPGLIHPLILDVTDRKAVDDAVSALPEGYAAITVLVNNAGLALGLESADAADLDDWERMIDTNIKGLAYCTRAVLPGMAARGRGHVINIASVAGNYPYPGGNAYGATKAFVQQFTQNLRADLIDKNIRTTDISPGMSETEFSLVRFKGDESKAAQVYAGTQPLTADDIAESVFWAATLPAHVNINKIEMMPVCQSAGPFKVHRSG